MGARQQPQLSNSRTMPQLNYTEADIQEQYLATNRVRMPPPPPPPNGQHRRPPARDADGADQNQSVRWRRTRQLAKFDDGGGGGSMENEGPQLESGPPIEGDPALSERIGPGLSERAEPVGNELADGQSRLAAGGGHQRTPKSKQQADGDQTKRKRRSRSASRLLSACLHIPAQLANSIASHHNQNQSQSASSNQRPHQSSRASSILAHFRIGHHNHHQHQHDYIGQQRPREVPGEDELELEADKHSRKRNEFQNRPISSSRTLGDLQSLDSPSVSQSGRLKHVSFGEHQKQKLASSSSMMMSTTATRQDNVISSNIQGSNRQQNQTPAAGQARVAQQQLAGVVSSQGRLAQPVPITGQPLGNQSVNSNRLQQRHQQANIHTRPQQATIYKRLPNIPMRTQATQTEITAYHLMQSPSGVSSAGSSSLAGTMTRQQLSSSARAGNHDDNDEQPAARVRTLDTPSSSLGSATTTLAPITSASSNQLTQPVASPEKSISSGRSAEPKCRNLSSDGVAVSAAAATAASTAERDDEQDDEKELELEIGPSLQASLLDSASNSSSSVSLVGHDSALADTLKCDLRIGTNALVKLDGSGSTRPMISASNEQQAAASGALNQRVSIIGTVQAAPTATTTTATVTSTATNEMRNNRELEHEIEPPSRFKDETAAIPLQQPSVRPLQPAPPPAGLRNERRAQMDNSDEEEDDEARTSPPSLSEASSQTDPSMANAHILNQIGRALERQASRAAAVNAAEAKRRSSAAANLTTEVPRQPTRRRQISIDDGRLAAAPRRRPSGTRGVGRTGAGARATTELCDTSAEEQLSCGPSQQQQRTTMERAEDLNVYATCPKSLHEQEPIGLGGALSSEKTSNLCSEVLQRRDQFLTGSPALSSSLDQVKNQTNGGNSDGTARDMNTSELATSATDLMQVLDSDELLAIQDEHEKELEQEHDDNEDEDEDIDQEPQLAIVEELQPVQLAVSQAIVERVRQPSSTTSTLSTRHHSYCSTDDFHESQHVELTAADAEFETLASEPAPSAGERLVAFDLQLDRGSKHNLEEQQDKPTSGAPDEASKVAPQTTISSSLSAVRKEEQEAPAAKQRDESELSSSSSCASNQTLKSVPGASQAAANGPSESLEAEPSLDSEQICSVVSQRVQQSGSINLMTTVTETEQTPNKIRTPSQSSCSDSFSSSSPTEPESALAQPGLGAAVQRQAQPDAGPEQPAASELPSAGSHLESGSDQPRTTLAEAKTASSLSPPTTVSDLDQDEELSSPSFVDSYKRRLEDHVNELADSFTSSILDECLESVEIAAGACNKADDLRRPEQREARNHDGQLGRASEAEARENSQAAAAFGSNEPSRIRSRSTSSSSAGADLSSATTTTSLGGSSYVRLEGGQVKRRSATTEREAGQQQQQQARPPQTATTKPELPRKPAHLAGILASDLGQEESQRDHRDERATAVAITASSIAAAAALHANGGGSGGDGDGGPSQGRAQLAAPQLPATEALSTVEQKKTESRPGQSCDTLQQEADKKPLKPQETVRLGPSDQSSNDSDGKLQPAPSSSAEPGELSTSDKLLAKNQQQREDFEGRVQDIRPASSWQAQAKPAGLIRQVSASAETKSATGHELGAANRVLRHSLSERSSSLQHSGGKATIGTSQARSTPTPPRTPTPPPPSVDCPFVAGVTGSGRICASDKKQTTPGDMGNSSALEVGQNLPMGIKRTLSHDDTMEAIKDDVEGEEQEMKLLDELQHQQRTLNMAPSVASGLIPPPLNQMPGNINVRGAASSLSTNNQIASQSIQEEELEDEKASGQLEISETQLDDPVGKVSDNDDDDGDGCGEDDEESSISVSKEHGVVVESSIPRAKSKSVRKSASKSGIKMKRFKRSSSNSDSSSSSARGTPVTSECADDGSQPSTPTAGSASASSSDDSTKTGSPAHSRGEHARELNDQSDKSESQCELLIGTPTSQLLVDETSEEAHEVGCEQPQEIEPTITDESAEKASSQSQEPSSSSQQHDSTESATHAILEHLSRHQHSNTASVIGLDEPDPSLELYRSLEPLQGQQQTGWLNDSGPSQRSVACELTSKIDLSDLQRQPESVPATRQDVDANETDRFQKQTHNEIEEDHDDWTHSAMSPTRTGTMKRRRRRASETTGGENQTSTTKQLDGPPQPASSSTPDKVPSTQPASSSTDIMSKRRPPLSELKCPANKNENLQSSSFDRADMDNSICSSCSCMETSLDQNIAGREPMAQISGLTASTSKQDEQPSRNPQPDQKREPAASSSWISQEEGTVFTENYWLSHWLYISEHEEAEIWRRAIDLDRSVSAAQGQLEQQQASQVHGQDTRHQSERDKGQRTVMASYYAEAGLPEDMSETASTTSERSFNTRYKSTTRKMIHRRASIEMFKRIQTNNLKVEKRIEISRSSVGEFGFRIHGSRPVVVSAIERGTSAETCGLQVGDLIYAINDTNILDMAHSDVVRLAHEAGSSALILDLIPTNNFLKTARYNRDQNKRFESTVSSYLMRLSPSTAQPLLIELQDKMSSSRCGASSQQRAIELNKVMRLAWRPRYFVLRSDNCLYWYRSPEDMVEPLGGLNLQGFSATLTDEFSEPDYVIRLVKYGGQPHYIGSNNMCDIQTWVDAINRAATEANQSDPYMKHTLILARCKPNHIEDPDCSGWLYKFSHKSGGGAHWRAAYFVLKDACLYLFRHQKSDLVDQASAVYYLHGYRVRSKHIEHKKHTFELIPPNRKTIKPMFLMASNEIDKKRWIAALEYSIDRWIEIN